MSRYLLIILFFWTDLSLGQSIQILNESTREPVSGAIIYDESQTRFVESNIQGFAVLNLFDADEPLMVQHPSFYQYSFTKNDLIAGDLRILLKERVIKIDEVVISANKWEQKKSEIPFEIMALEPNEAAFDNSQTAADALEATGQVFVQKSQLGGGSPMIRGFGANAVLIVVDGVRMNNAIFRGGNLQNIINIDPNSLESSEVIFGPGAVIYGSDALGGVMDFHTLKPLYSHDNKMKVDGQAMARYSSANNEKTGSFLVTLGKSRWGYLGNLTLSDFGDLRTGAVRPGDHPDFGKRPEYVQSINGLDSMLKNSNENIQRFSGYKQINTLHKLTARINGQSELSYTFNFSNTTNIPRYDRLIVYDDGGTLESAEWYYGPQLWMMHALKLNLYKSTKLFDAMKLTGAYQFFEESRHDRKFRNLNLRNRAEKVDVLSFNADFEKEMNSGGSFFYGMECLFNHVNSTAFSKNVETGVISDLSTRYPDGGSDVYGFAAYFSHKRPLGKNMYLSGGLRYNYLHLESKFTGDQFDFNSISNVSSAFNGNIGLVYKPGQDLNISGMLSTGFRAPNVDDISKVFDSEPGNVVVPNPNLDPEYSYNAEMSVTKIFRERVELHGTIFYSFLRDAIVRDDFSINGQDSIIYDGELSKVQAYVNTGRANIYGFNAGIRIDFSNGWSTTGSVNLTEGRDLEADEPLRHATPLFGMGSVQYQKGKFKGEFFARFNGKRSLEDLPPSERSKTYLYSSDGSLAWYTLNLQTQYQVSEHLSMNIALENILDHHYRTYSSGISAPGRNLIISIRARL